MSAALIALGANVLGGAVGAAASSKERGKAREMDRIKDSSIRSSAELGGQISDYARSVGTPQDAMFYGGLASSKFKKSLADSEDAFKRSL